jgi:hypothetical protein
MRTVCAACCLQLNVAAKYEPFFRMHLLNASVQVMALNRCVHDWEGPLAELPSPEPEGPAASPGTPARASRSLPACGLRLNQTLLLQAAAAAAPISTQASR